MFKIPRQYALILAMAVFSLLLIFVSASTAHAGRRIVVVCVLGVILGVVLALRRGRSQPSSSTRFLTFMLAGLIFVGGAVYGLAQSLEEGWQWIDLLYLVVPTGLGAYFVWLSFHRTSKDA